jgi:hypothetical protein
MIVTWEFLYSTDKETKQWIQMAQSHHIGMQCQNLIREMEVYGLKDTTKTRAPSLSTGSLREDRQGLHQRAGKLVVWIPHNKFGVFIIFMCLISSWITGTRASFISTYISQLSRWGENENWLGIEKKLTFQLKLYRRLWGCFADLLGD